MSQRQLTRTARQLGILLLAATPLAAQKPAADSTKAAIPRDTTAASITTVTFMSGTEIYVGAGRLDGLLEGAEIQVMRRDTAASTLRVKFVSSHQASCEVVKGATDVAVGDIIRYYPQAMTSRPGTQTAERRRPRRLSGPGLHGRIGTRYLRATTDNEAPGVPTSSTGFNQPSFDVRVNGLAIGGTPIGLALDLRTRRTTTSSTGQPNNVDGHTRVYQAAVFWGQPGAGLHVAAGRQYLTAVTSVSMFDGALVEVGSAHFTVGGFGGFEPSAADLGFSSDIQDLGGYVQLHNGPKSSSSWAFTTGAVGSYTHSKANREFGFMQLSLSNQYFSLYGLQEIDYYRPWKVQLGEKSISWTNQYASGLIHPSRWLTLMGSYDNRRSVRLYRDAITAETEFDDAYRQGYGAGVQVAGRAIRLGGDWRHSTGGTAGGSNSYTGTFGLDRFTPLRLSFSARATFYQNQNDSTLSNPGSRRTTGQLYSGRLGFDPIGPLHVDLNGGIRREDNPTVSGVQKSQWYGVDLDAALARAWFVSFSALRQKDPGGTGTSTTTQLYGSVTWRF